MFESNLLPQINTASPLPTFVEVELVNSINTNISKAFQFAHVLLAERSDMVAQLLPWSSEIWLVFKTLLEHRLLFHANTAFAEMIFGLRRGVIASPSRPLASEGMLSWFLRGPMPMPSLEEMTLRASGSTELLSHSGAFSDGVQGELTAAEAISAHNASYGHLKFRPLNDMQRYITLFFLTLNPYLSERAAKWYAGITDSSPDAISARAAYARRYPTRARLKQLLSKLYLVVHTATGSMNFLFRFLFLLELTPYTTLSHRIFGIAVRRLTGADQIAASNGRAQWALMLGRVVLLLLFVGFRLLELTGTGTGATSSLVGTGPEDLAIPKPPVWGVDVTVPPGMQDPKPGVCPVCERRVTNAAVCTVSGVVGCYPCLQSHVKENGVCPVTMRKTTVECVRRIYEC